MIKAERFSFTFDADDGTGVSSIGLVIVNVRYLGVHRSNTYDIYFPVICDKGGDCGTTGRILSMCWV